MAQQVIGRYLVYQREWFGQGVQVVQQESNIIIGYRLARSECLELLSIEIIRLLV